MKYLVTGGAGFIGSALCEVLLAQKEAEVTIIDKMTYAANPETVIGLRQNDRFSHIEADICDAALMRSVVLETQPDQIFHLAAESHVDRSIDAAGEFIQTNVVGTFSMLEAARIYFEGLSGARAEAFRFLHVSTDEVFGSLGEVGLFTETTRYDPSSPYSASKAGADHLVSAWGRTYGLPVLISNCSNNYGARQFPEKLIPLIILNAIEGKPLPVYGQGTNIRDWLHVDDHAAALLAIVQHGKAGETYNVGGNSEKSNIEVVRDICRYLDQKIPKDRSYASQISFVSDRPGHDLRYAIDASKVCSEIGWEPQKSFEGGLRETIDWYLENKAWWQPIRDRTYQGERLGTVGVKV